LPVLIHFPPSDQQYTSVQISLALMSWIFPGSLETILMKDRFFYYLFLQSILCLDQEASHVILFIFIFFSGLKRDTVVI